MVLGNVPQRTSSNCTPCGSSWRTTSELGKAAGVLHSSYFRKGYCNINVGLFFLVLVQLWGSHQAPDCAKCRIVPFAGLLNFDLTWLTFSPKSLQPCSKVLLKRSYFFHDKMQIPALLIFSKCDQGSGMYRYMIVYSSRCTQIWMPL